MGSSIETRIKTPATKTEAHQARTGTRKACTEAQKAKVILGLVTKRAMSIDIALFVYVQFQFDNVRY